jgi:hypothetical protein
MQDSVLETLLVEVYTIKISAQIFSEAIYPQKIRNMA